MKKNYLTLLSLIALIVIGCSKSETQPLSAEKELILFEINGVEVNISSEYQTIGLIVPEGTDVTSLSPTISVSTGASISPASGVLQNFSEPVVYTVTAEDGSSITYTALARILSKESIKTRAPTIVSIGFTAGGFVSPSGTISSADTNIPMSCTAYPHSGYILFAWTINGLYQGSQQTLTFLPSANYCLVEAIFVLITSHTITVQSENTNQGTVTGSGTYTTGQTVYITATHTQPWYVFDGWYKNGVKQSNLGASASFTATESCSLVAKFKSYFYNTLLSVPYYPIPINSTITYNAPSTPSWIISKVWKVETNKGDEIPFTLDGNGGIIVTFTKSGIYEIYCELYAGGNYHVASFWHETIVL